MTEKKAAGAAANTQQLKEEVLAELKSDAEAIIAQAQKQAEQQAAAIIAAAQAQADPEAELPRPQHSEAEAWLNEYVTVELFKDSGKYKDDVYVSIGDENCLIQRGKPVQVKRKFALALDLSRRQQHAAATMQDEAAKNAAWS